MRRNIWLSLTLTALIMTCKALSAQPRNSDVPRYEVAGDFSLLSLDSGTDVPGVGGRFTYNLNKHVALEAAGYFFPGPCESCAGEVTGKITEGLFGIKVGQRSKRWGIFGKARPGFASFSRGGFNVSSLATSRSAGTVNCFGPNPASQTCFRIESTRVTPVAFDVGGVIELYPSKRIVVRFDGGDTILHYRPRTFNSLIADPNNPNVPILAPVTAPSHTRHSFQFMGGVGIRF